MTTLSEPLSKVVSYVQRFRFFDADSSGRDDPLRGPRRRARRAAVRLRWSTGSREAIKTRSPKIIVIDSFRAIHDLAMSGDEMRRFISTLAGLLSAYDVDRLPARRVHAGRHPALSGVRCRRRDRRAGASAAEHARRALLARAQASRQRVSRGPARVPHHERGLELYPRLVAPRVPEEYESSMDRAFADRRARAWTR